MQCVLCNEEIEDGQYYCSVFRQEIISPDSKHAVHAQHFVQVCTLEFPKPVATQGKITGYMREDASMYRCTCGWSSQANGFAMGVFDDACQHEKETGHVRTM